MTLRHIALALMVLGIVALVFVLPVIGAVVSRRRVRTIEHLRDRAVEQARDTVVFDRPFFTDPSTESDWFFQQDPLGSHSLPIALADPTLHTDLFVSMVAEGELAPPDPKLHGLWVPWGYELADDDPDRFVDIELELDLLLTHELESASA